MGSRVEGLTWNPRRGRGKLPAGLRRWLAKHRPETKEARAARLKELDNRRRRMRRKWLALSKKFGLYHRWRYPDLPPMEFLDFHRKDLELRKRARQRMRTKRYQRRLRGGGKGPMLIGKDGLWVPAIGADDDEPPGKPNPRRKTPKYTFAPYALPPVPRPRKPRRLLLPPPSYISPLPAPSMYPPAFLRKASREYQARLMRRLDALAAAAARAEFVSEIDPFQVPAGKKRGKALSKKWFAQKRRLRLITAGARAESLLDKTKIRNSRKYSRGHYKYSAYPEPQAQQRKQKALPPIETVYIAPLPAPPMYPHVAWHSKTRGPRPPRRDAITPGKYARLKKRYNDLSRALYRASDMMMGETRGWRGATKEKDLAARLRKRVLAMHLARERIEAFVVKEKQKISRSSGRVYTGPNDPWNWYPPPSWSRTFHPSFHPKKKNPRKPRGWKNYRLPPTVTYIAPHADPPMYPASAREARLAKARKKHRALLAAIDRANAYYKTSLHQRQDAKEDSEWEAASDGMARAHARLNRLFDAALRTQDWLAERDRDFMRVTPAENPCAYRKRSRRRRAETKDQRLARLYTEAMMRADRSIPEGVPIFANYLYPGHSRKKRRNPSEGGDMSAVNPWMYRVRSGPRRGRFTKSTRGRRTWVKKARRGRPRRARSSYSKMPKGLRRWLLAKQGRAVGTRKKRRGSATYTKRRRTSGGKRRSGGGSRAPTEAFLRKSSTYMTSGFGTKGRKAWRRSKSGRAYRLGVARERLAARALDRRMRTSLALNPRRRRRNGMRRRYATTVNPRRRGRRGFRRMRRHLYTRNPGMGSMVSMAKNAIMPAAAGFAGGAIVGFIDAKFLPKMRLWQALAKFGIGLGGAFLLRKNAAAAGAFVGSTIGTIGYAFGLKAGGGHVAQSPGEAIAGVADMAAEDPALAQLISNAEDLGDLVTASELADGEVEIADSDDDNGGYDMGDLVQE